MLNNQDLLDLLKTINIIVPSGKINKQIKKMLGAHPHLVENLINNTSFFEDCNTELFVRLFAIKEGISEQPKCKSCGKNMMYNYHVRAFNKYCPNTKGHSCVIKDQQLNEQRKQTCLERYGSCIPQGTDVIRQKTIKTCLERYGTEAPYLSGVIREKGKQTCLERYGVENPTQNKEIRQKLRQTCLERYGTTTYAESLLDENVIPLLSNKEWCEENIKDYTIQEISLNLGCSTHVVRRYFKIHKINPNIVRPFTSAAQREIARTLITNNIEFTENDRSILKTQDVDIFIPELMIAIEYDGIYFHTENTYKRHKSYHANKTNKCKEKGIDLLHIWSNDWLYNKEAVKAKILRKCGVFTEELLAISCNIRIINQEQFKQFNLSNSIQEEHPSKIYGLFNTHEMVCCLGINKSTNENCEISCYITKQHTHVIGGFGVLLNYMIKDINPTIVYFNVDKRWGIDRELLESNFQLNKERPPTYYYINLKHNTDILLSKYKFQKNKLHNLLEKFDPTLTEWENMKSNKYDRIWDCGHEIWKWER